MIDLLQLHPEAPLLVLKDQFVGELGLVYGARLIENWDSPQVGHFGLTTEPQGAGWVKVQCPDDRILFVKFLSRKLQLISAEAYHELRKKTNTMPKAPSQKKKAASKKAASAAAKTTPEPSGAGSAAPAVTRKSLRDVSIEASIKKALEDGLLDDLGPKSLEFFVDFIEGGVSNGYAWLPNRWKTHLAKAYSTR